MCVVAGARVSCRAGSKRVSSQHVSLVIADDETVRALNSEYRGLDKTTDVLSFAFDNEGEYYGEGDTPSDWSPDEDFRAAAARGRGSGGGDCVVPTGCKAGAGGGAFHSVRENLPI